MKRAFYILTIISVVLLASTAAMPAEDSHPVFKWNTFGAMIWYQNNGFAMVYIPALNIDKNPVEIKITGLDPMVGKWSKYGYYFSILSYSNYLKFVKKMKRKNWKVKIYSPSSGLRYKGFLFRWIR